MLIVIQMAPTSRNSWTPTFNPGPGFENNMDMDIVNTEDTNTES